MMKVMFRFLKTAMSLIKQSLNLFNQFNAFKIKKINKLKQKKFLIEKYIITDKDNSIRKLIFFAN